jgi:hypothetical protein
MRSPVCRSHSFAGGAVNKRTAQSPGPDSRSRPGGWGEDYYRLNPDKDGPGSAGTQFSSAFKATLS